MAAEIGLNRVLAGIAHRHAPIQVDFFEVTYVGCWVHLATLTV
jgi:hypothetical protein